MSKRGPLDSDLPIELAAPARRALDAAGIYRLEQLATVCTSDIAQAVPNAQRRTLERQQHNVEPAALAPVLKEFFST